MFNSKNLIKVVRFGVYLAMLTPLVYIQQALFGTIFGKVIYFQIIIELTLPFFLYLIIFHKNLRPGISWLSRLILLFFGLLFLSSLLGVDWSKSFWGNDERMRGLFGLAHFLLLYFYIITVFKAPVVRDPEGSSDPEWEDKKKLLLFIIIVGSLVSVFGVAERINPELSIDKVSIKAESGHRVISTLGNPIFLAGYLTFIAFLSLYYYLQYKDYSRWIGLGNVFLSVLVIFFTGTRGAFLGLIGGAGIIAILLFFNTTKKKKIVIGIFASVVAILLLLVFVGNVKSIIQNKYWNFARLTDFSLTNEDGSTSGRILLWQSAFKAFRERPLLGWGAENFDYAFDKYYNPQFYRGGINETWSDRAHNWFLDFLVMGGAIGLVAYLAIFVYLGMLLAKKDNRTIKANFAFWGLFLAFLIFSFFAVDDPSTTLMLFVSLAFVYPPSIRVPQSRSEAEVFRRYERWVFLCFLVSMLLCAYFYNLKPLYQGIDFLSFRREALPAQKKILAEKFLSSGSPYSDYFRFRFATEAFLSAGVIKDAEYAEWSLDRAEKEMKIVLNNHPDDYSYFHTLGNIYLRSGGLRKDVKKLDKAIMIYKKALEISPKRQATIFQMSTAYLLKGQFSDAIKILKEAVLYDTKVGQTYWRLGIALLADDKTEEAYRAFKDSIFRGFFDTIEGEQKQVIALCVHFKDYNCAISVYKTAIDRTTGSKADLYAQLAATYAANGQFQEARDAVYKAVELDPSLTAEAQVFLKQIGY